MGRSAFGRLLSTLPLLVLLGCPDGGQVPDAAMNVPSPDLAQASPDLAPRKIQPGDIGSACTKDTDCTAVTKNAVCFRNYLFNSALFLETKDGYCSASCTADAECGNSGACYDFGQAGSFCLARCKSADICRHPGYLCMLNENVCFPEGNQDCDPTVPGGACQAQVDPDTTKPKVAGGCLRDSYEDRGHCAPACTIGPNSCPPDLNSQFRHCVYLDRTMDLMLKPTRDKWKGLLCLPDSDSPRKDRQLCSFFEDCVEGDECSLLPGGDDRCHPLCVQGGTPQCATGFTCTDSFKAGPSGPGLCL